MDRRYAILLKLVSEVIVTLAAMAQIIEFVTKL